MVLPPPTPQSSSSPTPDPVEPQKAFDEARLALIAAAERERVKKGSSSRSPRRFALIGTIVVFAGLIVFAAVSAPKPPARSESSGDPKVVAVALASGIDTLAAPTGLSSDAYVTATGPSAVVTALASASSLGVTASDVVFSGTTGKVTSVAFQMDITLSPGRISLVFPSGSAFCLKLATAPKAPSEASPGSC